MSPAACPGARFDRRHRRGDVRWLVGVDEVGRGSLAGPVVAAAVVLPPRSGIDGIRDSKTLGAADRARLAEEIRRVALCWGIAFVGPRVIDAINIRRSSLRAMGRAVGRALRVGGARGLDPVTTAAWFVLVDGIDRIPDVTHPQECLIEGDARSESVAAASIVAKVARDMFMARLAADFPDYAFERNKGYGTPEHVEALDRLGPCRWHRLTYAPVAQLSLALDVV
jgi:ribonuclease HII